MMSQFHFLSYEAADLKPGPEIQSWLITKKLAHERRCISERYRLSSTNRKVTYHEGEKRQPETRPASGPTKKPVSLMFFDFVFIKICVRNNNTQTPGSEIIVVLYQNYFKIN